MDLCKSNMPPPLTCNMESIPKYSPSCLESIPNSNFALLIENAPPILKKHENAMSVEQRPQLVRTLSRRGRECRKSARRAQRHGRACLVRPVVILPQPVSQSPQRLAVAGFLHFALAVPNAPDERSAQTRLPAFLQLTKGILHRVRIRRRPSALPQRYALYLWAPAS